MAASMLIKQIISKQPCIFKLKNCLSFCKMQRFRQMQILLNGTRFISCQKALFSGKSLEATELKKRMESLTDKFAEAREMLGDARESQGTVYFSEDLEDAQIAVTETLTEYRELLDSLSDSQRQEVISTIGLRMEELKAQQAAIEEELKDH